MKCTKIEQKKKRTDKNQSSYRNFLLESSY